MLYGFFIFVLLGDLFVYFRSNKNLKKIGEICLLFFISLIFVLSRDNHDYDAYVSIFDNPEAYAEVGYIFLVKVVKFFGGDHNSILIFLGLVVFITFFRISYYIGNFKYFLFLYFLFPGVIDVIQIRNTLSVLFCINALLFAIERRFLYFFIFCALSVGFHLFGIVYISLVLIALAGNYFNFKRLIFIIFLMVLMICIFGLEFFNDLRTFQAYGSESIKYSSLLIWGGFLCLDIFFIRKVMNRTVQSAQFENVVFLYRVMCASIVFLPLLLFLSEANRVFRFEFVIKYAVVCGLMSFCNAKDKVLLIGYSILTAMIMAIYYAVELDADRIYFRGGLW